MITAWPLGAVTRKAQDDRCEGLPYNPWEIAEKAKGDADARVQSVTKGLTAFTTALMPEYVPLAEVVKVM